MLLVFKFRVIKRAVSRAQDEECFIIIVIDGGAWGSPRGEWCGGWCFIGRMRYGEDWGEKGKGLSREA